MSRRRKDGRFAHRHSPAFLAANWGAGGLSFLLLLFLGRSVMSNFGAFRSCNANNAGLYIANCGKSSLNPGDLMLLALFILAAALTVSLFTNAWRVTRKKAQK